MALRITRREAVKRALERLLAEGGAELAPYQLGAAGFGADDGLRGDVARRTKRLMRERFRGEAHH